MDEGSRSPANAAQGQPDWRLWSARVEALLCQAVALSCNVDPENAGVRWYGRKLWESRGEPIDATDPYDNDRPRETRFLPAEFLTRLRIAIDHVQAKRLPIAGYAPGHWYWEHGRGEPRVRLAEFAQWAVGLPKPWELPPEFPRAPTVLAGAVPTKPPKGETRRERAARLAKEKFSRDLAAGQPWPTDPEGTQWLLAQKYVNSERDALVVLKMIRPDDLKRGPRAAKGDLDDE